MAQRAPAPGGVTPLVRPAAASDAASIAAIYDHHVRHGTATFDTEAPNPDHWQAKVSQVQARGWPFLIAEVDGKVLGYAYATQFRDRPAYAATCENSIYVAANAIGQGIGATLLAALIDQSRACGFEQMIAVVGGAEPASIALHARHGFVERGRMKDVGFKFGRTLDTVYMQLTLA